MNDWIKKGLLATTATATFMGSGLSDAAAAEPAPQTRSVGLGVGASLGSYFDGPSVLSLPAATIAVPIRLGTNWRIEPNIRGSYSASDSNRGLGSLSGGGDGESETISLQVGTALHHLTPVSEHTFTYAGLRAAVGYAETEVDSTNSRSENEFVSLIGGPVLGGEYLFSDTFSMGVEVAALYAYQTRNFDNENESDTTSNETSSHGVESRANLFVRMYLW